HPLQLSPFPTRRSSDLMNWYPHQQQQYYPPPNKPNHTQQVNNLKAYFQDSNGQVDFDKMFSTVGQLANTVQQVSPVIKQVGSLIDRKSTRLNSSHVSIS